MAAEPTPTLSLHLHSQDSSPQSTATPSQQVPSSSPRASLATTSTRPQREAATKARKRVEEAYTLYPSEQDPDSDSDATLARRSAPRPTLVHSDDSGDSDSDSDTFVDDSESDCPRPRKAALRKKRKRSRSPILDQRERRNFKVRKVDMEDKKSKEVATGFMVKSGNVVKDILLGKARRASRESLSGSVERVYGERQHQGLRRAGLSDMGPVTGSYTSGWRDEVWSKAVEGFALESRKGVAKGPVDGNGYRASKFSEHL